MKVRSSDPGKNRVALFESNPAHPGGEVFIHGNKVVDVAMTTAVANALRNGMLVEVTDNGEAVPAQSEVRETAAQRRKRLKAEKDAAEAAQTQAALDTETADDTDDEEDDEEGDDDGSDTDDGAATS